MMIKFRFFFLMIVVACWGLNASCARASSDHEQPVKRVMMGSPGQYYHDALEAEARGDLADASLALRRALVLKPQFPQAQEKLHEVLAKLGVPIQSTWKTKLVAFCSPDLLVLIGSLVGWSAAFLGVWLFFRRYLNAAASSKKKIFSLLCFIIFLFFLGHAVAFLGTMIDPRTTARHRMIVLPPYDLKTSTGNREDRPSTTPLRATPVDNATIIAQIPTGSSLLLRSRHGVWSYVQMESGQEGWIASSALQPLVPAAVAIKEE